MRFLSRFAVAALLAFAISCLIASASYSLGLWLAINSYNLFWIIYASIPFALLVGIAAAVWPRHKPEQQRWGTVAALAGAALSFLYTLFAERYALGPPAFIVLMLSCWVPSGISAMVVADRGRRLSVVVGIAILCVAAVAFPEPVFDAVSHNQQLTVAFVTPSEASTAQLEVWPQNVGFHTDGEIQEAKSEVLEHIRALGYTETFRVLSITRDGKGRKSLAIVVVRTPIQKEVFLPEPDSSTVVYVQQSQNWEKEPAQAPVLRRGITLRPPDDFEIPDAQGISLVGRIGPKAPGEPR